MEEPRLLFVCTADTNRSPMAAGLLARDLLVVGRRPCVASAGVLEAGHPASTQAVELMARRGVNLSGHRTRQLSAPLIGLADLVLGMENRHVRAVTALDDGAQERTFTLKDFLRRALTTGRRAPDERVADYAARLGRGRDLALLDHDDPAEAVADPAGGAPADFERCAEELELLVRGLRYFLWDGAGAVSVDAPPALAARTDLSGD